MKKFEDLHQLIDEYGSNIFYKEIIKYFSDNIKDSFGYQCRKNISLNESLPLERFGSAKNQRTIFVSARSFDIWENAIYETVKHYIENNALNEVERWNDNVGDMKFNEENWEIKSTQNTNGSWTGSTHSFSKCDNYILLSYELDWNHKFNNTNNEKLLKTFSLFLVYSTDENISIEWNGTATNKSSFSSLMIKKEWLEENSPIKVVKIAGDLKVNRVNCKVIPVKTESEDGNE